MALTTASQERNGWIQQARARLAARENQKPVTKAGAVRALWPEIERALKNGQSLKTIRDWLEEEGVLLTYNQLTTYVGRIRRRQETAPESSGRRESPSPAAPVHNPEQPTEGRPIPSPMIPTVPSEKEARDPLANVRAREAKRPTFEYNPDFKEDELI